MRRTAAIWQVAFTYIGTVVGAGFATGQEILQFFTKYGGVALFTILVSTALFIWLGTKIMLLASEIGATSYEDLNKILFGKTFGEWFSLLLLLELFSVSVVMLAGAGSVFEEHLGQPFLLGVGVTLLLGYFVITRGMKGIIAVNSIVVPLMLLFTGIVFWHTLNLPEFAAGEWAVRESPYPAWRAWLAPLLYSAFNLTAAQAVLVPLGATVKDRKAIRMGGLLGGIGLGALLIAGHISLSMHTPAIFTYEIPMGMVVAGLGAFVHLVYLLLIYAEIFTTFIADVFGLTLQMEQRTHLKRNVLIGATLLLCFGVSLFGFKALLSTLYPLFGCLSLTWFGMLIVKGRHAA
ncbi:YkvI family membrane protein [Paenibacillus thermotolerans]|uniref:YkvI family membrane protein n=1 Tax=Paenibacillus thermotolerans TaxID=3027807 RepID=UPI0023688149|nr:MULTISPECIES: hypothetical protein [unclassified Paenibacillus]